MSLLKPIRYSQQSPGEFNYYAATQPTGFGEYLGAKLTSGFDFSLSGRATDTLTGPSERFGPLPPDTSREDAAAMGHAIGSRRITEDEWRKLKLDRPGLAFSGGGTVEYETARTRAYDERRYRDSLIARYQGGLAGQAAGFAAAMLGGLPSPENFVPFVGPGVRAAMVARMGAIGGRAGVGALDATIGTALADAIVLPDLARRGEDVGAADFALDLALGAATGGLFGTGAGVLARRAEGRARQEVLAVQARAVRLDGLQRQADALEVAQRALADDAPVDVGPVVQPADATLRRRLMGGAAIFEPYQPAQRGAIDEALGGTTETPFPPPPGISLLGALRAAGGIRPDSELDIDWRELQRRVPGIVRNDGLQLDSATQVAIDGGFLSPIGDDVNLRDYGQELGRLIQKQMGGERVESLDDQLSGRDLQTDQAQVDRDLISFAQNEMETPLSGNELAIARQLVLGHDYDYEDAIVQAMTYAALRNDGGTFDGGAAAEDFDIPFEDLPGAADAGPAGRPAAGAPGPSLESIVGRGAPDSTAPADDIGRFVTDYITRETEAARHPSIVEAEASVGRAPPKTGVEEAQRLAKDMDVENPPELDDIKVLKRDGLLTAADEAELERAAETVKDANGWATAYETLSTCVLRYS